MSPGLWQLLLVAVLALLLFGGRGKLSAIMGDLAKGITSFRKGLKDDAADTAAQDKPAAAPTAIADRREATIDATPEKDRAQR